MLVLKNSSKGSVLGSPPVNFFLYAAVTMAEERQGKATQPEVIVADDNMIENGVGEGSLHCVLTSESAKYLIRSVDAFLFDCDGLFSTFIFLALSFSCAYARFKPLGLLGIS